MAYHRPLDAYEEYIVRKHEREAQTTEFTLEFVRSKEPWIERVIQRLMALPPRIQGLLMIFPGSLLAALFGTMAPDVGFVMFVMALYRGTKMVILGRPTVSRNPKPYIPLAVPGMARTRITAPPPRTV